MRRAYQQQQQQKQQGPLTTQGVVRGDKASPASSFRELDDAFLQTQTKIWLGEVLHLRIDQDVVVADLLADGELLFQVSKVIWKRLLRKNNEQLKQSKVYIYERTSFGKSNGKYTPYPKVDSFVKICQILGLAGIDLFTPSDVVEKRNVRKVCMCIRSLSKKARMMNLNVPDFDIVTHTISMPNYVVGGIRRSLEQPQCSSSGSSGYSPCDDTKALHPERIFGEQNHQQCDTNYDSDEAESSLFVLEPEDSIDDENLSTLLQLSNAPKEEMEGYGDNGHDIHDEKSLSESVGSFDFGVVDSESVSLTPSVKNNEARCSRTITRCSISSQESDSISSHLAIDGSKDNLDSPPVTVTNRTHDEHIKLQDYSIQGNGNKIADHPIKENDDLPKDTSAVDQHCDVLVCDRDSVCPGCEEPRLGINAEPSDLNTCGKLPAVSEDDNACRGLKPDFSTRNQTDATQSEDEPVKSEDTAGNKSSQRKENDAPKSGKGVLKSVAGGITLVGAVFFIAHLRRNKGRSFTTVIPSLSEKTIQGESGAKNVDKGKASAVYPGEWLKV